MQYIIRKSLDIRAHLWYTVSTERERKILNTRKVKKMTRFEKDLKEALEGNEIEVLSRRKAEIKRLTKEGKSCKNAFRRQCIAQEVVRLTREYNKIDSHF